MTCFISDLSHMQGSQKRIEVGVSIYKVGGELSAANMENDRYATNDDTPL
jgi:hypothetical protein